MVHLNKDDAIAGSDGVPRSHSAFWQPPQGLSADRDRHGGFEPPPKPPPSVTLALACKPLPLPLARNQELNAARISYSRHIIQNLNGQLMPPIEADDRLTLRRGGEIVMNTSSNNDATCFFDTVTGATEIAGAKVPSIYNLPDGSTVLSSIAIQIDACSGSSRITACDGSIHRITRHANGVQTVAHEYRKFHSFGNAEPIIVLEVTESIIRTDGPIETIRRIEAGGITIDRQTVPMTKPNG